MEKPENGLTRRSVLKAAVTVASIAVGVDESFAQQQGTPEEIQERVTEIFSLFGLHEKTYVFGAQSIDTSTLGNDLSSPDIVKRKLAEIRLVAALGWQLKILHPELESLKQTDPTEASHKWQNLQKAKTVLDALPLSDVAKKQFEIEFSPVRDLFERGA
jgi:hypothetical protein